MSRAKMVYVSDQAHAQLKVLAARSRRPMGKLIEEWVRQEAGELANPWTGPEGLLLQQRGLATAWEDPALDVYDRD